MIKKSKSVFKKNEVMVLLESMNDGIKIIAESQQQMREDMAVIKEDVEILKGDMVEVKKDIRELKEDVTELKSDMVEVKGRLTIIERKLDNKVDYADFEKLEKRTLKLEKVSV